LDRQQFQHRQAREQQQTVVETTSAKLEQVRSATAVTLTAEATADALTLNTARQAMRSAAEMARRFGPFGRKTAQRNADTAQVVHQQAEARVRRRWGSTTTMNGDAQTWAGTVARQTADTTPEVVSARQTADQARANLHALTQKQQQEQQYARACVYGPSTQFRTTTRTAAQQAEH
jgi:hypothetical protein